MLLVKDFDDYEIISMSDGEKLERWGNYYLLRPDPEIIWKDKLDKNIAHAHYHRSNKGGGVWEYKKPLPDRWTINYKDLTFNIKLMGFKHTGVFPEQSVNWDFMMEKVKKEKKNKYDAIVMDPPSYGRGSKNEVWDIEKDLFSLVVMCKEILVEKPLFFIINSYTASLSSTVLANILNLTFSGGFITSGELGIPSKDGLILPAGVYARYER